MAVGTGIGAGILIDGQILRGSSDIAGCTGWLALDRPYHENILPVVVTNFMRLARGWCGLHRK